MCVNLKFKLDSLFLQKKTKSYTQFAQLEVNLMGKPESHTYPPLLLTFRTVVVNISLDKRFADRKWKYKMLKLAFSPTAMCA
jgi:hypothetical protein